jgi:multidrug transporter EmrE-like cation transporter
MLFVVIATVIYHVSQKTIDTMVHPAVSLVATYTVSLVISLALLFLWPPDGSIAAEFGRVNRWSLLLGVAIVGIEIGFLLIYRSSWPIGTASLVANGLVAAVLFALGVMVYGEALGTKQFIGLIFALIGLVLING